MSTSEFFPFGTHYYCVPNPLPDEWADDLAAIARAGYTHVQFRPLWRWHEPRRGQFRWDDTDRLVELAGRNNLRVILKPMLENAPDYAFVELDGTRIGFHGVPITRFAMNSAYYAGGYMPCFDNPEVIAAGCAFVDKLVRRYKDHPALWCYNAWNEPRSRPLDQCQCEHSAASYRAWLRDRFGTIDRLNDQLWKAWDSYETIIPPASNADLVEMYLWRQWAAWAVAEQVRAVRDTIAEADPGHFIMMHAGSCDVARDPAWDACDDRQNARLVARYGMSLNLPPSPATPIEHNEAEYQLSWLRRVDPDYFCHEFYPKGAPWSRSTPPATLARHLWMALAGGCSGLTFWEYRSVRMGIRANGFGLREMDGSPSPRSRVAEHVARIVATHGGRLARTRRGPAPVALFFSKRCDLLHRLEAMDILLGRARGQRPDVDYPYKQALRGAHTAWQLAGQPVDFVTSGDDLSNVSLLHVTAAEIIDRDTATWLREFIHHGGHALVEMPFASRDWKTWIHNRRPGHGLDEVLGLTEGLREQVDPDQPDVAHFDDGTQAPAATWRITLEPHGAEPIARWADGSIAAATHAFGKGHLTTLGVNLSLSAGHRWDDPVVDLYEKIAGRAGLHRPDWAVHRDVWIRRRIGPELEVYFVFNVSTEPRELPLPATPRDTWHLVDAQLEGNTLTLAPGGTAVIDMPAST